MTDELKRLRENLPSDFNLRRSTSGKTQLNATINNREQLAAITTLLLHVFSSLPSHRTMTHGDIGLPLPKKPTLEDEMRAAGLLLSIADLEENNVAGQGSARDIRKTL